MSVFFIFSFIFAIQIGGFTVPEPEVVRLNNLNFERTKLSNRPLRLFQDSRGLIWIGTMNGIAIYDGRQIIEYTEDITDTSAAAFRGQAILGMDEDSYGRVWVAGSPGGLNVFDKGKITHINNETAGWEPSVSYGQAIFVQDSIAWFTTRRSVSRIEISKELADIHVTERELDFETHGIIHQIIRTEDGRVLGLGRSIFEISFDKITGIRLTPIVELDQIHKSFIEDKNGNLIVAHQNTIKIFRDQKLLKTHTLEVPEGWDVFIWKVFEDRDGVVWIGTRHEVFRLTFDNEYNITDSKVFKTNGAADILQDFSGNLFFAPYDRLFWKLSSNYQKYEFILFPEEYKNKYAHLFVEDDNDNVWIGGETGIILYNRKTQKFTTYKDNPALINEYSYSIMQGDDGTIWAGTASAILRYDTETLDVTEVNTRDLNPDFFDNGNSWFGVHNVQKDRYGNIWMMVQKTIVRIDSDTDHVSYIGKGNDTDKFIIGSDNRLWVWGSDWKLRVFELNEEGVLWNNDEFLDNTIEQNLNQMVDDGFGQIWISWDGGVLLLDKKTKSFTKKLDNTNILRYTTVDAVHKDLNNNIWIKQKTMGSIAVNPRTLKKVFETPNWLRVTKKGHIPSVSSIGREGRVYTDGFGETTVFYSNDLLGNDVTPIVALSNLHVNQNREDQIWYSHENQSLTLSHSDNNLEFQLSSLQFDIPSRNQYSYYLEGFDDTWSDADEANTAKYFKLPPGDYRFWAKSSNSDGVWSDPAELATIRILPPWWANPVAYSIYVLVIGFIGYRYYRIQVNKKVAEAETKRLKEVDEFKTRFFTNISHEFRTPLTVIMGLADRIQHESVPIIKINASKLLELINQILELSKVEANQVTVKTEQFDLNTYVHYLIQSLESLAKERGIELSFNTVDEELFVDMDRQKVDLILHNLLSNALKFTERDGHIHVKIAKHGQSVIFSVSDDGIGIKEEALDHLFDRFFQSDTDNHRYEGSGIGLALTNELVQLLGGTIRVESKPGSGSEFTVTLPASFVEDPKSAISLKTNSKTELVEDSDSIEDSEVILLVEDNYDVRTFIKQVLSDSYSVQVAHNGKEGIEQAIETVPDIIISDVMMPCKDGLELTDELKQDARTSHIPIILLTAKADVASRISGLETGADVYLGKPFNEDELKAHLRNLLKLRNSIRIKYSGEEEAGELQKRIEDPLIKKLRDTILEHLDDDTFGIEDVCKTLAVSRTQLHRKLKAVTGKSTSIFIRDLRLIEARKLLRSTRLTVSEIAYSVGFGDPNYFTKLYSQKFDCPPSKERKQANKHHIS